MKGLQTIPTQLKLIEAYEKLQSEGTAAVTEATLVTHALWTRFDPRLGEIWVDYVSKHWKKLSPLALNQEAASSAWPAVLGVLLEMIEAVGLILPDQLGHYRGWKSCALVALPRQNGEQYYIGVYALGGHEMRGASLLSTRPYRAWGFLGVDLLINKSAGQRTHGKRTQLSKKQRKALLAELCSRRSRISVKDYIEAARGLVSLRQAQIDLRRSALSFSGKTRNRVYRARRRLKPA